MLRFPSFDTLRGVRGEMNIQVKLQFFGDGNRFSDSSAGELSVTVLPINLCSKVLIVFTLGVQFFSMPCLPPTYHITAVLGFVSSLDTEDDPEYVGVKADCNNVIIKISITFSIGLIISEPHAHQMTREHESCSDSPVNFGASLEKKYWSSMVTLSSATSSILTLKAIKESSQREQLELQSGWFHQIK
jgi:hypothetical protein